MKTYTYNQSNSIPAFIAFGKFEPKEEVKYAGTHSYDYESQIINLPMFMGSDQKVTRSAKREGLLFPTYKNVNDDAKEK